MTYFIRKSFLFLAGALIFVGCAEKESNSNIEIDPWKVEQPTIHHLPSKFKLKERELRPSSLFSFPNLTKQTNLKVEVQSICKTLDKEIKSKSSKFTNKVQFRVKDIIAQKILNKPILKDHNVLCDFIFKISNERGSTQEMIAENMLIRDIQHYSDFLIKDENHNPIHLKANEYLNPSHVSRLRVPDLPKTAGTISLNCDEIRIEEYFNNLSTSNLASLFHRLREAHPDKLRTCKLIAMPNNDSHLITTPFNLQEKPKKFENLENHLIFVVNPDQSSGQITLSLNSTAEMTNVYKTIRNAKEIIQKTSLAGFIPIGNEVQIQDGLDASLVKVIVDGKEVKSSQSTLRFKQDLKLQWSINFPCTIKQKGPKEERPQLLGLFLQIKNFQIEQSLIDSGDFNSHTDLVKTYSLDEHLHNNILLLDSMASKVRNLKPRPVQQISSVGAGLVYYPLCE